MDLKLDEIIEKRQSIRKFKPGDVPRTDLEKMVNAARQAPSGKNVQNWHFIIIKDRSLMQKIADAVVAENEKISLLLDEINEKRGYVFRRFVKNFTLFFLNAPALVVVMTKEYRPSGTNEYDLVRADIPDIDDILRDLIERRSPGMQSLGAAVENFSLKCVELGYGSCWLTSANYAAAEIEELMREEAGFDKEGWYLGCLLSVGIPEDNQRSPMKKNLEEIFTYIE